MQKVYIETTIPSYIVSKASRDIIMELNDPIVEEVRKAREQLLEKYNGFDGFIRYLKKMEKKHKEKIVKQNKDQVTIKHS